MIIELTIVYGVLFRLNLLLFRHLRPMRICILERMAHREMGYNSTLVADPAQNYQSSDNDDSNCCNESHYSRAGV